MCGLCALAALTVWKISTPPSTLILSISVIQVMNTPLRDMPSLKGLSKRDIYRRVLNAPPHDLMHLNACTHMDTHACTCKHTHTFMDIRKQITSTHTCKHTLVHTSLTHSHMTIRGALISFCFFSTSPIILSKEPIGGRPSCGQERKWKRVTSSRDSVLCKKSV